MAKRDSSKNSKTKHQAFTKHVDLKNRKPKSAAYEISYQAEPALRVRIQPTGTKTFIWRAKFEGKQKVFTIGTFPRMAIAEAHKALDDLKKQRQEKTLFEVKDKDLPETVSDLADIWYRDYAMKKRKNPEQARHVLDKDILPVIGNMKMDAVKPIHITKLIKGVVNRPAPVWAGKVLGITKQIFKYGESLGYLDGPSPAYSHAPNVLGVENNTRERFLSVEELPLFWAALEFSPRMSNPVRVALRMLLLSGVRSGELTNAKWTHIDLDKGEWFIPAENSKTRAWTVPLSSHLTKLFEELQGYSGGSEWVVPGAIPGQPVTNKVLGKAMRRLFEVKAGGEPLLTIEPASPHDLRRTMRSHMDDLDIEPHISEKCLNHSLGILDKTYNQNKLLTQRRDALEKWGTFVMKHVDPRRKFIRVVK